MSGMLGLQGVVHSVIPLQLFSREMRLLMFHAKCMSAPSSLDNFHQAVGLRHRFNNG